MSSTRTPSQEVLLAGIIKVPLPVICTDAEQRVLAVNDEWLHFVNYARDDAVSRPITAFMTRESGRYYEKALLPKLASSHVLHDAELTFLTSDGARKDVLFSARLESFAGPDGPVAIGVLVDLIALRHVEQELLRSNERYRTLVEGITDYAVYMLEPDGRIANWNRGAQRIKGYASEDVIGKHYRLVYTEEDRQAGLPEKALEAARVSGRFESQGWRVRKDGSRFWVHAVLDAIRDEAGNLVGFAKISRDLTEQRQQQETLEQARAQLAQVQKMEAVGQLTGGVAHDFNNLLTAILGNAELLQRNLLPPEAQSKLAVIREAAERGAALTHRLLAFSRKQALQPRDTDLNRLVRGMAELIRRTLPENITVETVPAAGLWRTHVDQNQLENVLLNLVVNAKDAMPNGGSLTIETANTYIDEDYASYHSEVKAGQYVLLEVTDSGAGMTPDVADRVFEPFFTTKPEGKGTGLGLSQAFGFVKQSGGHIKLYSEVGQGTTVKVYLPRNMAPAEAEPRPDPTPPTTAPLKTVLIVEDDPSVLEFCISALQSLGYRALPAQDANVALSLLDSDPSVAVLLTDVGLPGISGRQLADEAQHRRPELKVLFMTGYARNAIVHQGLLDLGVELLPKPFTIASLARKLRQLLGA